MLKNISNLKGTKILDKKAQKKVCGGRPRPSRPCGGTGGIPINYTQQQCYGWGIVWHNGQCYACY